MEQIVKEYISQSTIPVSDDEGIQLFQDVMHEGRNQKELFFQLHSVFLGKA